MDSTAQTALASRPASIATAYGTARMALMSSTAVSPLPALVDSDLFISAVPGPRVLDLEDESGKAQGEGCAKVGRVMGGSGHTWVNVAIWVPWGTISCLIVFTWALPSSA